jgi:hypothetical protein
MMRHPPPILDRGFRSADIHPAIKLPRIRINDLNRTAEVIRDPHRKPRLSGPSRPDNKANSNFLDLRAARGWIRERRLLCFSCFHLPTLSQALEYSSIEL